ncbi:MAG: nucleotide exchange factor GrpE, partial [Acidimicrobiales bacterium]
MSGDRRDDEKQEDSAETSAESSGHATDLTSENDKVAADDSADEFDAIFTDDDPELVRVVRERDEFLKALQHLQADFENYKKRVQRDQAELTVRANDNLITKLLPALDTLSLALTHAQSSDEDVAALAQVHSAFFELLKKEGLEEYVPVGEAFDPSKAEAVAHEDGDGGPVVVEVFRSGF